MIKRIIFESSINTYKEELNYTVKVYNLIATMGNTIGNMIRRLLITSIPGTSIQGFSITGLEHGFDYTNFIDKDADQIGESLREIIFTYQPSIDKSMLVETAIQGPKKITAQDIFPNIKIINGDLEIFNLLDKRSITIKVWLINGMGFSPYYKQEVEDGIIAVTSIFTHNKNVTFDVTNNNIDDKYEDLVIKFTTYKIFEDDNAPIKYALEYMKEIISNIYFAIDNKMEDISVADQENALVQETEAIINQAQPELASYIYESNIEITNTEALIEFLLQIPTSTSVNNVKIKKKEVQNILKLLNKLKKSNNKKST